MERYSVYHYILSSALTGYVILLGVGERTRYHKQNDLNDRTACCTIWRTGVKSRVAQPIPSEDIRAGSSLLGESPVPWPMAAGLHLYMASSLCVCAQISLIYFNVFFLVGLGFDLRVLDLQSRVSNT
jgi:hypothetical protein